MKSIGQKIQTVILAVVTVCGLAACGGSTGSDKDPNKFSYLAVMIEKGNNWSIMDADGKIVVKEEYPANNVISAITESGVYWVRANNKYSLYSVKSPKKPLTPNEYDDVTCFSNGRAFVSVIGEPIQMVDESGKVIKTLSEDIVAAYGFSEERAIFTNSNKLGGFLDRNGEITIKAKYEGCYDFGEGKAVVIEPNRNRIVIDKSGNTVYVMDTLKYLAIKQYQDGVIAAMDVSKDYNVVLYLDKKGEVAVQPSKESQCRLWDRPDQMFSNGIAVAFDTDGNTGLIDKKGEFLIRYGKYTELYHIGDGFLVAKNANGKTGIIDKDDNVIVPFDYSGATHFRLGNYFIMEQGSYNILVDRGGKELKNSEFYSYNKYMSFYVNFVNIKANVKAIADLFKAEGYAPLIGKTDAVSIANIYGVDFETATTYKRTISSRMDVGDWQADVELVMDEYIKKRLTHKEVKSDGWFAREEEVFDGYGWNPESKLIQVNMDVDIASSINVEDMKNKVKEQLIKNGFQDDGMKLYARNGSQTASVRIDTKRNNLKIHYKLNDPDYNAE